MALSAAQRVIVFEMLDVTMSAQMGLMVDMDHMSTFAISYGDNAKRTSLFIDARLNYIAANEPQSEERLIHFIDQWDNIDTDPSSQSGGAVGALSGISDDPTRELDIIKGRVSTLIGLRAWNEKKGNTRSPDVVFGQVISG
jgi:hypothetical protein